jgi:N4-gp56 family major capsid protein
MTLAVNGSYTYGPATANGATTTFAAGADGYGGRFIPQIWSGKLQVKFYQSTVLSAITNNDWEGEIKDQGDKVEIRTIPSITISNYSKGQTLSSQVPTGGVVELNIDQGKYFQVVVDDVDDVQSDLKLMDIFTNDAAQQMKIAIDTDVLSAIKNAAHASNQGAAAGALSGNVSLGDGNIGDGSATPASVQISKTTVIDKIVGMGQVLDEQNIPETGRWLVIPAWMAAMIKQSDLKDASITGDSQTPLRNGRLGTIDRFTIYVSNLLPKTAGAGTLGGTFVYAGTNDAITFASQITKVESLRSQSTFGNLVRGLNVYGYKVIKPEALVQGFFSA